MEIQKLVLKATLKDIKLNKGLVLIQFECQLDQVVNYIQLVKFIGKPFKINAKVDDKKMCFGDDFLARRFNIDMRDGDSILLVENEIDELQITLDEIKTINDKPIKIQLISENSEN